MLAEIDGHRNNGKEQCRKEKRTQVFANNIKINGQQVRRLGDLEKQTYSLQNSYRLSGKVKPTEGERVVIENWMKAWNIITNASRYINEKNIFSRINNYLSGLGVRSPKP